MRRSLVLIGTLLVAQVLCTPLPLDKIVALWHCGDDGCTWGDAEPDLSSSAWILDRGDGLPVANVINLAFADPYALLKKTNDSSNLNGIPRGFTDKVVKFFQSKGIFVIASIGGESYGSRWDAALQADAAGLGRAAATMANSLNLNGIEIDYEVDSSAQMSNLNTFVRAYRSVLPYSDKDNFLTVDLGAGTGYLSAISTQASIWLNSKLVNWVYAMVSDSPWGSIGEATPYWQQHLDAGVAASQLVVCIYAESPAKNCHSYDGTVAQGAVGWIKQKSTRGLAYWSVGCDSACVTNCSGINAASKSLNTYTAIAL